MDEEKLHEPPKPADEVEKPKSQSIIISANGLKITSKLNPDAKEFYPAHLLQRNLYRQTFALSARCDPKVIPSVARPLAQPHEGTPSEADTETNTTGPFTVAPDRTEESAKTVDVVVGDEAAGKTPIVVPAETVDETKNTEKVVEKEEEEEVEQQEATVEVIQSIGNADEAKDTENNENVVETSSVLVATAESTEQVEVAAVAPPAEKSSSQQPADAPDAEKAVEEEGNEDQAIELAEETLTPAATISILPELSEAASDVVADIDDELSDNPEACELPEIIEEIKENIGLFDGVVTESVGDVLDHNLMEQQKNTYGAEIVNQMEIIPENIEVIEVKAPPPTPTDELHESRLDQTLISRSLKEKPAKDDKKKSDKRSTTRKFASFGLGLSRKTTTTHTEKTSTKNTSSSSMTRTKRISESLHNLSSSLKSKVDIKKSDGNTRLLPRSSTNIPRPPVRLRTLLSKSNNEPNGVSRKDAVSIKSTGGSTDRSITSTTKTLNMKSSATITKNADKPTTTMAAKSKDSPHKPQPRGTVASSLRQTEAQKRRNLFPNDDPESNIELSQFLFK